MKKRAQRGIRGFSLMELLIVVGIIGIIAAIAIPNLLEAQRIANEAHAQKLLDIMVKRKEAGKPAFTEMGYRYVSLDEEDGRFAITAIPDKPEGSFPSGSRSFYVNEHGVVYEKDGPVAPRPPEGSRIPLDGKVTKAGKR